MNKIGKTTSHPIRLFLCHASNDKPAVRELYRRLVISGFDVWLDEEKLLPGQEWDFEIRRAVQASDVVVICLSKNSVTKEGYVQKEIRMALDYAEELPKGTFFLVPVKLDECEVPRRLRNWQWINLYEANGYDKFVKALFLRADALTESTTKFSTNQVETLQKSITMAQRELAKLEQLATEYTVLTIPIHLVRELDERRQVISQLETELSKLTPQPLSSDTRTSLLSGHDIFLSYSRKDNDIMLRIKSDLEREGFSVWVDQTELELGTAAWEIKIQDALERSGCLVVLMSPDSKQSTWVMNELSYAERHNVRIFPVLARGNEADAVPFKLSSTMWVDIRDNYSKALKRLVIAVKKQIGVEILS